MRRERERREGFRSKFLPLDRATTTLGLHSLRVLPAGAVSMDGLPKWLIFHVAFGAVPYFASVALRYFKDGSDNPWRSSPEIIFLVLVASASALGEISFGHRKPSRFRHMFQVLLSGGAIIAAMLYGAYLSEELNRPGREAAVDCAVVFSTVSAPGGDALLDSIRHHWEPACTRWLRTEERYFAFSNQWAVIFTIFGAVAIFFFGPAKPTGGL